MAKGVPLALALLMLTATLSGCLGGEEVPEPVDVTPYTNQIEANNVTISQLLTNISQLESNHASSQAQIDSLQQEIVKMSGELADANQNIATLELEKSDLENQLATANQDNEAATDEIAELEATIALLNASLNENISTVASLQAQLSDAFSDLSEANTQISLLESQWSNANQTIAQLAAGWASANSTIASLLNTYSAVMLTDTVGVNYSPDCRGISRELSQGLDNGDGNGTASDGQLHPDEIDSVNRVCPNIKMVTNNHLEGGVDPAYLTAIGTTLYFRAYDRTHGVELWRSDGTASGTLMVKDLMQHNNQGVQSADAGSHYTDFQDPYFTAIGSTIFFRAGTNYYDAVHAHDFVDNGTELWKTDGTANGTIVVKDINIGSGSSNPTYLTAVGNSLYFSADDGTNGTELWKSDGTANGTMMLKDINNGSGGSTPQKFIKHGNTLFFVAYDTTNGYSLWKSDGTTNGTIIVKDINDRNDNFNPFEFVKAYGNTLYFSASDGTNGYELWRSDGTANGTMLVKDIYNGTGNGYFGGLTAVGNTLYFVANDGTNGSELWKSDGTANGTVMVKNINSAATGTSGTNPSSNPEYLTAVGNTLFFRANDGTNGTELWKSDGTANGTVMVKDIYNGNTTRMDFCCFSEANPGGSVVYVTDPNDSNPSHLIAFDNALYFAANDGNNGIELWKSDGTANGTTMVQDIQFGYSSSPIFLTAVGNTLYFRAASDEGTRSVLWTFSL